MPIAWRSQIEAHEIHRGKGLEERLSLVLSTIQSPNLEMESGISCQSWKWDLELELPKLEMGSGISCQSWKWDLELVVKSGNGICN
ncbi:hypothetical protein TNCV_3628361 [Trichonephila clavipes]|nr:hypothetical protein TNCV_3628361 [Trichonephila clavipes]